MTSPSEQDLNRKTRALKSILKNYQQAEESIVKQLYMEHTLHGGTAGSMREDVWKGLFEMILPKKFVIEQSVFIIDSQDGISHEVDLAIVDETYTPYIFHYGRLKFIPIEAVAAVVECKSRNLVENGLKTWCESIVSLKTADESIARLANMIAIGPVPTQGSTRPIRILCTLTEDVSQVQGLFDFVLVAVDADEKVDRRAHLIILVDRKRDNLYLYYKDLNFNQGGNPDIKPVAVEKLRDTPLEAYMVVNRNGENISLLSFNFQLNQLLILINNPMLFPHREYVNMFRRYINAEPPKDGAASKEGQRLESESPGNAIVL